MILFKLIFTFFDKIIPKTCLACNKYGTFGHYVCSDCVDKMIIGEGYQEILLDENGCTQNCRQLSIKGDVYLSGFEIIADYSPPINNLIKCLKYDKVQSVSKVLGEWLWLWAKIPWKIDYICHVPLHPRRFSERGFNQAQLLASGYSLHSKIVHLPVLERKIATTNQAAVSFEQRQKQLKNIFDIRAEHINNCADKNFLIIDDVLTTGNTFNECAKALKRIGGANRIYALALAHG